MKIQTLVILCDEFLFACIAEVCCESTEPAFNHILHFFIATCVHDAPELIQVREQVKIPLSQVRTVRWTKISHASAMRKWSLLSGRPSHIKVPVLN